MTYKADSIRNTVDFANQEDRILGCIQGKRPGPTVVFFGGVHGNEPSGVEALTEILDLLGKEQAVSFRGFTYGIKGNIKAIREGKRFLDEDLNRIWHRQDLNELLQRPLEDCSAEEKELRELYRLISSILEAHEPPFYFIDLHSTSGKSIPFMTINDALINRMFARCFPAPIILGIEEYLNGPLLSFLNEDGYVALGFEAGQHDEREAVENAKAFIWLALAKSGFLSDTRYRQVGVAASRLRRASGGKSSFYEITYRLSIAPGDSFEMQPGFRNFDPVAKGSLLAIHNGVPLYTKTKVLLFMPLYQKQGEDGYFLIRFIPAWIMSLSAFLRRLKLDALFPLLPGVGRYPGNSAKLVVNLKLVRFFSRRFFHLMGYRHKQADMHHAIFTNRERMAKNECYREESWYRDSHGCN